MDALYFFLFLASVYLSLYWARRQNSLFLKLFGHCFFILGAVVLSLHLSPWVQNIKVIDKLQFSPDSLPFTMYVNFDKPFVGLIIILVYGCGRGSLNIKKITSVVIKALPLCSLVLLGFAFLMDYVRFDFKFPQESYIWAMNNLFLVCFAEEAFFRRYLQGGLSESLAKFKWGKYFALIVSAILFGLAHFKGGIPYVLLSSLAGLFYGWTYMKSQRLEAAILTHFGLNSIHFFFFSYPALY